MCRPNNPSRLGGTYGTLRIFVSSKIKNELTEERKSAGAVIEDDLKQEAVMWEKLPPAMSMSPEEAYLNGVRDSEVYVGIIGTKYSPGPFEEFEEASRTGKKILIFLKAVSARENEQNNFVEKAREFKCADYTLPVEFPTKLRDSILALMAEQTVQQLAVKGGVVMDFVKEYNAKYIRPVLEETNAIVNILRERQFVELPVDVRNNASRGIFVGVRPELDKELTAFYEKVMAFNNLRILALSEYKQMFSESLQNIAPINADSVQRGELLQRLMDNASFFIVLREQDEAWYQAYDRIQGVLSVPLANMASFKTSRPRDIARDLINVLLGERRRRIMLSEISPTASGKYNKGFDELLPVASQLRERLTEVYSGRA